MTYKEVSKDDPRKADFGKFREGLGERLRQVSAPFANRTEVAKSIGVGKSTFQSWVEGRAAPSFEAMARLAQVANVSPNWLAFGDSQYFTRELVALHVDSHDWMGIILNEIRAIYTAKGWDHVPEKAMASALEIYSASSSHDDFDRRMDFIKQVVPLMFKDVGPPQSPGIGQVFA